MQQCHDFSFNLDGHYLPKWAIYARQERTATMPARWIYVLDPREPAHNFRFKVYALTETGERYSFWADSRFDRIGMQFADFVDQLPRERICAPVWRIRYADQIGQPQERKPQKMLLKGRYYNAKVTTDKSVVDGHIIGGHRYRQEGYYALRLGM